MQYPKETIYFNLLVITFSRLLECCMSISCKGCNMMRLCFRCVEDVKKSMGGFLQYVGTLKGLASIRDAIWELLNPVI